MKILFKVFPQKSHFNATFTLARALKAAGHGVIYAGVAQLQNHAEAQGFQYFVENEDIYPYIETRQDNFRLTFWNVVKNWRRFRRQAAFMRSRFASRDFFGALIRSTQPDIILVDSPYTFFALSLYRHRIPFAILESMMNLNRAPGCPPLDTTYVPTGTRLSNLICELHWRRYFLKRRTLGMIGMRIDFNRRFVLRTADAFGVDRSVISFDRYFHIGLRDVPELILSPRALDFPRTPSPNQHYVGLPVEISRADVGSDYRFERFFAEFINKRTNGTPLVYCSLGTAPWRYEGAAAFMRSVCAASKGSPWNLIMAIASDGRPQIDPPEPNIAIFQTVPQVQVLEHTDLMISHGGMNSISECNAFEVPMLIFPGTHEIDQAGNAARAAFHKCGTTSSLATAHPESLARMIRKALENKHNHRNRPPKNNRSHIVDVTTVFSTIHSREAHPIHNQCTQISP